MQIQIKRLSDKVELPMLATDGSAGVDLQANITESLHLKAGYSSVLIPTGISIYIKDPNYAAMILPRSGMGHKHGLVLGNLVGLIDSDYQGELMISAWNRNKSNDIIIQPGARIAQLIIVPVMRPEWQVVDSFEETERADGGFGSTGSN